MKLSEWEREVVCNREPKGHKRWNFNKTKIKNKKLNLQDLLRKRALKVKANEVITWNLF